MKLLASLLALALVAGLATSAPASEADVAMFYDALAPLGNWVDYGNYGPVWYPRGVGEDWRPYLNGRWLPTDEGWVFETDEPWGWACYHFGNWLPTEEYGWVWVPGSTWYPSTAAWRTSDSYIGWAPVPPPDYAPSGPFAPAEGANPDAAPIDLLTAPFWTLADAVNFLLGLDEPYSPSYSYDACGCLAPLDEVPDLYPDMPPLDDFYSPDYAPEAYYCFGPPFPFVAAVVQINVTVINNFVKKVKIGKLRHVLPPKHVLEKHPHLKDAIPRAVLEGEGFKVERVKDGRRAAKSLNRPHALAPPPNLPRLAEPIPKALLVRRKEVGPGAWKGIKGMKLPQAAVKAPKPAPQPGPEDQPPAPTGTAAPTAPPLAPPRPGEPPQPRRPAEPPRLQEEQQQRRLEQQRQREEQKQRFLEEQQQRRQQQQLLLRQQIEEKLRRRQELQRQQQERYRELQQRQQEMLRQHQQEQLRQLEMQRQQELQKPRELQPRSPDHRPAPSGAPAGPPG